MAEVLFKKWGLYLISSLKLCFCFSRLVLTAAFYTTVTQPFECSLPRHQMTVSWSDLKPWACVKRPNLSDFALVAAATPFLMGETWVVGWISHRLAKGLLFFYVYQPVVWFNDRLKVYHLLIMEFTVVIPFLKGSYFDGFIGFTPHKLKYDTIFPAFKSGFWLLVYIFSLNIFHTLLRIFFNRCLSWMRIKYHLQLAVEVVMPALQLTWKTMIRFSFIASSDDEVSKCDAIQCGYWSDFGV